MGVEHALSLPERLATDGQGLDALVRALGQPGRVDLASMPDGALALLIAHAATRGNRVVTVVQDAERARALERDLCFFLGARPEEPASGGVIRLPAPEASPFVDVIPDRRVEMETMAGLFGLAHGKPWRALIVPVAALARRLPTPATIADATRRLTVGDTVDRDELLATLTAWGYLRAPLVEDPGTFAVRGGLVDVHAPHAALPVRIELDFDRVAAIRSFDPDDQRTRNDLQTTWLPAASALVRDPERLERARAHIVELCDRDNVPSLARRALIDELSSGRPGHTRWLPAFEPSPASLFDHVSPQARWLLVDPPACTNAFAEELACADDDRRAARERGAPAYEVADLYLGPDELHEQMSARPFSAVGAPALADAASLAESDPLLATFGVREAPARLAAEAHVSLAATLKARRASGHAGDPLEPLARQTQAWLDDGMRVIVAAHSQAQAQRLHAFLRAHDVPLSGHPAPFDPQRLREPATGKVEVVVGPLARGFALPGEALAIVGEQDVFGARTSAPARRRRAAHAFALDLRALAVDDLVVHVEHGIGRYRGLTRAELPVRREEAWAGKRPRQVEALVIEYAGGDKLYLPVTRLNQVEKHPGAAGDSPRLDRLGGQSFARTRARVAESMRKLADELLALYAARGARERASIATTTAELAEFEAGFPHDETEDQARAISDVMSDLDGTRPMDRLVCGDVGFGKTEVALRAAFRVAMAGKQVGVLCPTTVLAQQHVASFQARLAPYPLRVEVLSRFVPKKRQAEIVAGLRNGTVDVVIGTHRLLSRDVHFKNLGLLVVDEEHRFGVAHKERIKQLRAEVDVLTLSATPIPRTLHMALGGLREMSLIATAPPDRRAVRTFVTGWDERVLREAIERELARGGQVFLVSSRIEDMYERSTRIAEIIPEARIATAHGRMRADVLERTMLDFVDGRYDILCSTAIVESGLDIPRANTMLIDRADRFGLAQLYQLRGRVGRARERGYCYLVVPPIDSLSDEARARVDAIERFSQLGAGFAIASLDMELRGAGDLLGAQQSGNLAAVGFELFTRMLEEAIAELRGLEVVHDVDPEIAVDVEHFLPDEYVDDVGLRLSFYKRLASAEDDEAVRQIGSELEDRFGPPPPPARELLRVMALKPRLRELRALGCDATSRRVSLHLATDTPLRSERLAALVAGSPHWQLAPEGTLTRRFAEETDIDAVDRVESVLHELAGLATAR